MQDVQDALLLAAITGAIVYLAMVLIGGRRARELAATRANEARFRALTELSADWFWESDPEHRLTWLSGGLPVATLFGSTPTYGKRFWEIPGIEVDAAALAAHRERLEQQLPFFDLEISRTDERGARQVHIVSGQSRLAADGRFLGYRGVGRDATEQRNAERKLSEAKAGLEQALEGGRLAGWHLDAASGELRGTEGWARLVDPARLPALGGTRALVELAHPDDREAVEVALAGVLQGGAPDFVAEFRAPSVDGGWKWLYASARVTERDAAGRALRLSGTLADVDARRRAEEALRDAEERYRALVELAPDGVVVHSDGIIEYANAAAARLLGAGTPSRLAGVRLEDLTHPDDRPRLRERLDYLGLGPGTVRFEERRMIGFGGRAIVVECAGVSFLERGRLVMQSVFRDASEQIKAREALAEREQRFRDVVEASGEYVWETDAGGRYTYLSERIEAVLGYGRAELLGRSPAEFMPLGERRAKEEWRARHEEEPRAFRDLVHRSITRSGRAIWQSVTGIPRRDAEGRFLGYRGTGADVTARKEAEARIEYLATRDALTGLPNRPLLTERGQQAILAAARTRTRLALLAIDLDRFKLVNDSLGHASGDALLRAVGERLQNALRGEDTLARLGGDDFVLLWEGMRSPEEAAVVAQRVLGVLARPFTVEGRSLNVAASIGVSVYPNDGADFAELLKNADAALAHAKESGRGTFRFFSPALNARAAERLRLENDLRRALARGELLLHWQPVLRGRPGSGRIVGAEALVRWQHPERGLLLPEDFVPLAEECGLIRAVGEWTLERALAQAGAWRSGLGTDAWFAVNVSAAELAQGEAYVERVRAALEANRLEGGAVEIEVTERMLMSHVAENIETLKRIGALGVRFAIDDFGTGYSSLAYLRLLPIDKLKIDRAFLREIEAEGPDEAIVRAVAAMARTLGISIAAEGVENAAQLERLLALGCDDWQGHHFSAPLPAAELERLLSSPLHRATGSGSA